MGPTRAAQFRIRGAGVGPADGADAAVPLENLFAKVAGIGAKAPFVHAPIRTEREAPGRDFQAAPAAQRASVRSFRLSGAVGDAAGHGAGGARGRHNIFSIKCLLPIG